MQKDYRDVLEVVKFDLIEETVGSWLRAIIRRLEEEQTAIRRDQQKQPAPSHEADSPSGVHCVRHHWLCERCSYVHSGVRRRVQRRSQGALARTPHRRSSLGVAGSLPGALVPCCLPLRLE